MAVRRIAIISTLLIVILAVASGADRVRAAEEPHSAKAAAPPSTSPPAAPSHGAPPQGSGPRPAPAPGQKAEDYYKNIQVLKGAPADQLVPAMQFIAASLGVECEFCHVDRAPEKDDKDEKKTARAMMTMTAAINKDNFEGHREVTCNSCHHGATHPSSFPPVATGSEPASESEEDKPVELPTAEAVLAKYLQAVGGAEALNRAESRILKGKVIGIGPAPAPVEVYAKAPDKRISIVHTERGDSITAFDGAAGWLGNTGRPPREMSAQESAAARLDADFRFPLHVKDAFKSFRVTPGEKIDGHDTVRVVARNEGQPPVLLFFDTQSGLLLRQMRFAETPVGRNPTQIDYADYRDAGGVKIPYRWTIARPGGLFTIQIDEVQPNAPIEDEKFARPKSS